MIKMSPDQKRDICREIEAKGGREFVGSVARKRGVNGNTVDHWFLNWKAYGNDVFHEAHQKRQAKYAAAAAKAREDKAGTKSDLITRLGKLEEDVARLTRIVLTSMVNKTAEEPFEFEDIRI